jgi:hypothetical protein
MHTGTVAAAPWRAVQWEHPWYAPWRDIGQQVECQLTSGLPLWDALNHVGGAPVRFVPHDQLPPAVAYERFITDTGTCPTRPGLHDFFNGLCWIQLPATKRKLNQLQSQCIASDGIRPMRGALRDALTLFDENAAFLHAPQPLWDALIAKQWHLLFGSMRPLWREARLVLFGHALLEKMQTPRKAVTAHVYRVPAMASPGDLDAWIAADLNAERLAKKPFAHLPVLGVPEWWPANTEPGFYNDPGVFRLPRPGVPQ